MRKMTNDQAMKNIARALWGKSPPSEKDVNESGMSLAEWIERQAIHGYS